MSLITWVDVNLTENTACEVRIERTGHATITLREGAGAAVVTMSGPWERARTLLLGAAEALAQDAGAKGLRS